MEKPTRHLSHELEKLAKNEKNSHTINDIELTLATKNPLACLRLPDFITLLRVAIESHDLATGSSRTKTMLEMRLGLRMLQGETIYQVMPDAFNWDASFKVLGPFLAFIYQRMHPEVQMMSSVELPLL